MMRLSWGPTMSLFSIFCILQTSYLPAEEAKEHRQHGAHEHGHAILNIVQEKSTLQIMLETPAMNIVGFEHLPENDQEREKIQDAIKQLKRGQHLFIISAEAQCLQKEVVLETGLNVQHSQSATSHAGEDNDHRDHHADHEGEGIDHEEHHADFDVSYTFLCNHPDLIKEISVKLFDQFPLTQELDGQFVTERKQLGIELSPQSSTIRF